MGTLELRPIDASAAERPDWKTRALSVAIALLLLAGVGVAAVRTGSDSGTSLATADDLQLIQSSSGTVASLEAIEMSTRVHLNGQTTSIEGTGDATGCRFTVSIESLDDFEMVQVGDRTYLPAFTQPGWSEFIGPASTTEAANAVAGQDPLEYLRSISSTDEIEVLGQGSADGVEVTRYRLQIALADALRAAGDLGISGAEMDAILADASPMRVEIEIDDAGIPRRTHVTYEVQGIDVEIENRIRPVDAVAAVSPPPAGEIVSSHQATDALNFQQLIGSHIAQYASR